MDNATRQQATSADPLDMFDEQVRRSPGAPALRWVGRVMDYRELDLRSDAAARGLASAGVRAGGRLALFMPRGADFLVAALAALKLGAAYVPLDPQAPPARLRRMLQRCAPDLVASAGPAALPSIDAPELSLQELERMGAAGAGRPRAPAAPCDIAYVLHTSGSTGEPNAVQVTRAGLANYLAFAVAAYATGDACHAVWHTATTFDLSITSFLVPLVRGGCVDIVQEDGALEALFERLAANAAPLVVKITPTHGRAIAAWFAARGRTSAAELVFVIGGEELLVRDAEALRAVFPACRIVNEYGPTEATVGCCVHEWSPGSADGDSVPIGRPIPGMAMHVVGEDGAQAAPGERGEIVIAGPGVMAGYLGNAQLTNAKLARYSWAGDAPHYRTGDIGWVASDGSFRYGGRADTQVKLNGYRIELGEIEAVALEVPGVRNAAAVLQRALGSQLLALFAEAGEAAPAGLEQALAAQLAAALPAYMRPVRVVLRAALPVTPHGKIDRQALAQEQPAAGGQPAAAQAQGTVEETLVAVWQRVLQQPCVGPDDNYFALGGDSLRSIEITALAEERGVRFSIPQLHQNPTIRRLCQAIAAGDPLMDMSATAPLSLISEEDRRRLPPDVEDAYPLNLLQEGMIYHREFAAKSAVYHAICSYHVAMPVDVPAMRRAVHELVARHPLLRTSFDLTRYSRPLQLVHRASEPEFGYLNLRGQDESLHQRAVDQWLEDEKKRGFEIEQYPLIRFMLHHFSDSTCQLSYSFHHEIVDGWSDALMVTELIERYMALVTGGRYDAPPPQSTFRDAILLEQNAVAAEPYRRFWTEKMADVTAMRLPSFLPPKADRGEREIVKFEIPLSVELSDALKELARELAVPLKTVLLAAHAKAMSLLGGVEDVMTYTVSNGRPEHRDSHAVIGLFVNSLAFRMRLAGGSWRELILATLQTENELLAWRRYPMAEVKRQHGSEPLSETLFFFNHYHVTDALARWTQVRLLGLKVYAESTFPYCVNAYLTPFNKDLRVRIEYDSLRYDKEVMDLAGHFYGAILESMVRDPGASYHGTSFLPDAQIARLRAIATAGGQEAGRDGAAQGSVLDLFHAVAASAPERLAIATPGGRLSYSELARGADRVAAALLEGGLRPGGLVGILMARGAASLVATLGVLKAGGAYVPFSADQPEARLRAVLARIEGPVLCDDGAHALLERAGLGARALRYGATQQRPHDGQVQVRVPPASLAYMIFTSGSTGAPKAVMVSRANLDASTRARIGYYGLSGADRCVLLPAPSFDSAVGVIFGALASGAALLAPDEDAMLDLGALVAFMRRKRATMTLCTPSLLGTLLETEGFAGIGLSHVISAGEPLTAEVYARAAALPGTTVFNEYGPTEATVWASAWRGRAYRQMPAMPIGRAVGPARLYVLDRHLNPVGIGVSGELYIGGDGVSLGYLGEPAQTAAAFLPDPFADRPGARMYATGDLVRCDLEGELEFLTRRDRLIKVQGFRVELGEIEHVLAMHASVHRAVAAVRELRGARQLVCYVVQRAGAPSVTAESLRTHCKQRLPKYMVPTAFVFVEAVPLLATGKVDLGSLEQLWPREAQASATRAAPTTTVQAALLDIWRNVLHAEHAGIDDEFLDLGGESLAALRIAAKVRSTFGVGIPIRRLLADMGTVRQLADTVEAHARASAGAAAPAWRAQEIGEI